MVSHSQIVLFMWFVHFWPLSLVSKNPPQASSVLSDKVYVICRRSRLQRRSWEFQPCWMQKTWWLLRFLTASVSWHTSPSITTTSMDAPRVSIICLTVCVSAFVPFSSVYTTSILSTCLLQLVVWEVWSAQLKAPQRNRLGRRTSRWYLRCFPLPNLPQRTALPPPPTTQGPLLPPKKTELPHR